MLPHFFADRKFFDLLLTYDRDLAEKAQGKKCLICQANLHQAHFERKPRGGPATLDEEHSCRFSFCCYRCRKRLTPPSLRFLGRKVYLGAIIILVSAMLGGASPKRRRILQDLCGADQRTLARWKEWWAETFPLTAFWKEFCAPFALAGTSKIPIPRLLLRKMRVASFPETLEKLLRFLLPLTKGMAPG